MASTNQIKKSASGVALQVTEEARTAQLVEENPEGEARRLAPVRVYGFDDFLLVVDRERVAPAQVAELVRTASKARDSIYRGGDAQVQIAGNGYQVQLPGAKDAGFQIGDKAPVSSSSSAWGVVCIFRDSKNTLESDVLTIRREQIRE